MVGRSSIRPIDLSLNFNLHLVTPPGGISLCPTCSACPSEPIRSRYRVSMQITEAWSRVDYGYIHRYTSATRHRDRTSLPRLTFPENVVRVVAVYASSIGRDFERRDSVSRWRPCIDLDVWCRPVDPRVNCVGSARVLVLRITGRPTENGAKPIRIHATIADSKIGLEGEEEISRCTGRNDQRDQLLLVVGTRTFLVRLWN